MVENSWWGDNKLPLKFQAEIMLLAHQDSSGNEQTHGSFEVTANLKTKETCFLQAHFPTWLQPAIRHLSLSYSPWVLSLTVHSPQAFQKKTVVEYNLTSICEWFFPEPLIFHTLSQLLCSSRLETMGGSPFSQGSSKEMLITQQLQRTQTCLIWSRISHVCQHLTF